MIKKFLGIALTAALLVTSSVSLVYADKPQNGSASERVAEQKEKKATKGGTVETTAATEETVVNDESEKTIEELKIQFKEVHKDKAARKEVLQQLAQLRKENNNNSIPVFINGKEMKSDVAPVIKYGRTLIPVRAVTESLGAEVKWDEETKTVTVTKAVYSSVYGSTYEPTLITIELKIDSKIALVNGVEVELDTNAEINENRTFVPIRFIAETFKKAVDWDDQSRTVIIEDEDEEDDETPAVSPAPSPTPAAQ